MQVIINTNLIMKRAQAQAAGRGFSPGGHRIRTAGSVEFFQHACEQAEHLVDMLLLDDERRRERDDIAGRADEQPLLEAFEESLERARRRLAGPGFQLDRPDKAKVAKI